MKRRRSYEYSKRSGYAFKLLKYSAAGLLALDQETIEQSLGRIDYQYDPEKNQFV